MSNASIDERVVEMYRQLAILDGWTEVHEDKTNFNEIVGIPPLNDSIPRHTCNFIPVPDYCRDVAALRNIVAKFSIVRQRIFVECLWKILEEDLGLHLNRAYDISYIFLANEPQIAKAILKTFNIKYEHKSMDSN